MSLIGTHASKYDVPKIVMNTPVEVWREIIDHALFDPVLYLTDPFYPGCNLHTALDDFSNHQYLFKLACQQGRLRLVSHSWKKAVDASPLKYFEPYRDKSNHLDHSLAQSKSANRLELYDPSDNHIPVNARTQCGTCLKYRMSSLNINTFMTLFMDLKNKPLAARIPRLPNWFQYREYLEANEGQGINLFPNLKALFLKLQDLPIPGMLGLLSRLEFLSICLTFIDFDAAEEGSQGFRFPFLKILQAKISDQVGINFLAKWEMPLLAHLHLMSTEGEETMTSLGPFIDGVGANLISLRISCVDAYIRLSDNMWEKMPRLEYLGVSRVETLIPPPLRHPLHTFANLEALSLTTARESIYAAIQNWGALSTIAELHSWKNAPDDFEYICDKNPDPFHAHTISFC